MESTTLLLSQGYEPLATISWQRAISMLTLGKCEVVEEYDDRELRSAYLVIKMPAVVRLFRMFRRSKQAVKFSRQNIMARDRWKCQYCGDKVTSQSMTMDHVVPKSRGGITCWENIATACGSCNALKANKTLRQAGLKLRKVPYKPTWVPIFSIKLAGSAPEQWTSYLYWSSVLDSD